MYRYSLPLGTGIPSDLGMSILGARSNRPMRAPGGSTLQSSWAVARPQGPDPTMATSADEGHVLMQGQGEMPSTTHPVSVSALPWIETEVSSYR